MCTKSDVEFRSHSVSLLTSKTYAAVAVLLVLSSYFHWIILWNLHSVPRPCGWFSSFSNFVACEFFNSKKETFVLALSALPLFILHRKYIVYEWCNGAWRRLLVQWMLRLLCLLLSFAVCDECWVEDDGSWSTTTVESPTRFNYFIRAFYVCSFMFIFDIFDLPVCTALVDSE